MVQNYHPFTVESPFKPAGDQPAAIAGLADGIEAGLRAQTLLGVTGSGKTFTVAKLIEKVQRPTLVMAHNKTLAAQLYGEFREFFPHNAVEYFVSYYDYYQPEAYVAASDTYIEKDASINPHIEQMRLSATKALLQRSDVVIVATVSSIYGLGDPSSYLEMVLHLDRNEHLEQRQLLRRLAELQYTRNDQAFQRGTYRVRGDVIDIYPAESEKNALRIELFDNVIEALSLFDPLTGQTAHKIPRYTLFPKTHYVTPKERMTQVVEQIQQELQTHVKELEKANKLVEVQRLQQRTQYDIEMMQQLGYCSGIENYSRYLSNRKQGEPPPTLFDYLPGDTLIIVDESHVTIPQIGGMYRGDRARKENLVEYGFRLPSALDNRPLRFDEWEGVTGQLVFVSATPGPYEDKHSDSVIELVVRPTGLVDPQVSIKPATTQVEHLLEEVVKATDSNERCLVTVLTKRMAEDLTEYMEEQNIRVRYLHSDVETVERVEIIRDLRAGSFDVLVGINLLREGLDIPEVALVAILDADKEGFLRAERSLIQTMGRAARNLNGRVILYADKITDSMQKAIDETERRRNKQLEYNKEHGITPRGIQKSIGDIMEGVGASVKEKTRKLKTQDAREDFPKNSGQLEKLIRKLERKMEKHARNLEFEQAAELRDRIKEAYDRLLVLDDSSAGLEILDH